MERDIREAVVQDIVHKVIHTKANNLIESRDFIQHPTMSFIKNTLFTAVNTYLVEQKM